MCMLLPSPLVPPIFLLIFVVVGSTKERVDYQGVSSETFDPVGRVQ